MINELCESTSNIKESLLQIFEVEIEHEQPVELSSNIWTIIAQSFW